MIEAGAAVIFISPTAENPAFETPREGLDRRRPRRERLTGGRAGRAWSSAMRIAEGAAALLAARGATRLFVVTIPEPPAFSLPVLALLRLSGARILHVVHDPVPHAWRLPQSLRWLEDGLYALSYKVANALVVLSESSRDALLGAYRIDPAKVHVIEHGVFVRGAPVPPPDANRLLLFGALRRNKGVREAIDGVLLARARGVRAQLLIAGGAHGEEPDYWASCAARAEAHPEAFELEIGYVPDSALAGLIERSDAFLLPYHDFFSQSGVATMAASNARPVVATTAGGIGDLIAEGLPAAVIAPPADAESVADAIVAFFATPSATWWGRAGAYREIMLAKRSWGAIGRQYLVLADAMR